MATFTKTCAPTSRKHVADQGILLPNRSKTFQIFWSHFSVFALEKQPKKIKSSEFFTSKKHFGRYFQWNACTCFQKICSWTRQSNAKFVKMIETFWSHSSISASEKQPEKLNFENFFTSKRLFGDYFQWNTFTYFQKICSSTT